MNFLILPRDYKNDFKSFRAKREAFRRNKEDLRSAFVCGSGGSAETIGTHSVETSKLKSDSTVPAAKLPKSQDPNTRPNQALRAACQRKAVVHPFILADETDISVKDNNRGEVLQYLGLSFLD